MMKMIYAHHRNDSSSLVLWHPHLRKPFVCHLRILVRLNNNVVPSPDHLGIRNPGPGQGTNPDPDLLAQLHTALVDPAGIEINPANHAHLHTTVERDVPVAMTHVMIGAETHDGLGAENHAGAETHDVIGAETHTGAETHDVTSTATVTRTRTLRRTGLNVMPPLLLNARLRRLANVPLPTHARGPSQDPVTDPDLRARAQIQIMILTRRTILA